MKTLSSTSHPLNSPTDRKELINKVFALLKANGVFTRGVYDGLKAEDIPTGGMKELLHKRPFDAVRSQVGGSTITVEITTERKGEQDDPDAVRFACSDYETFRTWFFTLLRRSGLQPIMPAPVKSIKDMCLTKADLRSAPFVHHRKTKGSRR